MKSMIEYSAVLLEVRKMIDTSIIEYNEIPNIVYLGTAQIEALNHSESLEFAHLDIEKNEILRLRIEPAHASDFIGVGSKRNEMSAISPELVKARAEMMLGEHFRKFDFPKFILLGKEQFKEAVMFLELSKHTDKTYFCGIEVKQVPIPNYIGVI